MALSNELVSQFVKITNDDKDVKNESTVYGTTVEYNGAIYVKLDGSDLLTPISTTVDVKADERVTVRIKDHTATVTGNTSSPAARSDDVKENSAKISEFGVVMAYKVTTDELEAINATLESLKAKVGNFDEMSAVYAEIETLQAKFAELDQVSATDAKIINAEIDRLQARVGEFTDLSADTINAMNADINSLKGYTAEFTYVSAEVLTAVNANVKKLDAEKLSATDADLKYANIDFANIDMVAVKKLFSDSGIIEDLVVSDGRITGELVGVTIKGDLIEGNTIVADKLVVKGEDGLYYKLNTDGVTTEAEQTDYNSLNGSVITAKSITATKIAVDDLVAFGATIGGFNITKNAIYSGVKESPTNTTKGIYLDDQGQFGVGDSSNYLRYFKDSDGAYKLQISAASMVMSSSNKNIEEELDEIRDEVTTSLTIESSRGNVFKNDTISTVLSVIIYRGSQRITNMTDLKQAMGQGVYLEWSWQRYDDDSFGVISASDSRIGENGFTFTLSPDDVDTKVTFLCKLMTPD